MVWQRIFSIQLLTSAPSEENVHSLQLKGTTCSLIPTHYKFPFANGNLLSVHLPRVPSPIRVRIPLMRCLRFVEHVDSWESHGWARKFWAHERRPNDRLCVCSIREETWYEHKMELSETLLTRDPLDGKSSLGA
jgi:hypothetical protein